MKIELKLTEDEVVTNLMKYLNKEGWEIESYCMGNKRGIDIVANKGKNKLLVEAKGARANDKAHNKVRKFFDRGRIRTHLGRAIVKVLELRVLNPHTKIAIAHPNDEMVIEVVGELIPCLNQMGIQHYFVSRNGKVTQSK